MGYERIVVEVYGACDAQPPSQKISVATDGKPMPPLSLAFYGVTNPIESVKHTPDEGRLLDLSEV